jgi:hypothetical protein
MLQIDPWSSPFLHVKEGSGVALALILKVVVAIGTGHLPDDVIKAKPAEVASLCVVGRSMQVLEAVHA